MNNLRLACLRVIKSAAEDDSSNAEQLVTDMAIAVGVPADFLKDPETHADLVAEWCAAEIAKIEVQ